MATRNNRTALAEKLGNLLRFQWLITACGVAVVISIDSPRRPEFGCSMLVYLQRVAAAVIPQFSRSSQ